MSVKFARRKYGKELLIDCELMSEAKPFKINHNAFLVEFHELFIITEGQGTFKLDNEIINFEPGTILLLPPNKWRQWLSFEQVINGYFLIFEEEFISNFFNDGLFLYRFHFFYNNSTPSFVRLPEDAFEQFLQRVEEVRKELKELGPDSEHFLRSLLYYILILINRRYQAQFEVEAQFFENNLTLRFRKLLEKKIRTWHNVTDYATALQVSKSHLNKTLKGSLGKSTSEAIKERLIAEAKRDLLYSELNIAEISHQLNFSEPSNFNRFFKEAVQLTPKAFRALNSK